MRAGTGAPAAAGAVARGASGKGADAVDTLERPLSGSEDRTDGSKCTECVLLLPFIRVASDKREQKKTEKKKTEEEKTEEGEGE